VPKRLLKSAALAGLSLLAYSAQANLVLPVTNLGFNVINGSFITPKDFFTQVQPAGWSIGQSLGNLIYVGHQGTEGFNNQGHGNIYDVYTNPGFSVTVPPGTNFYQADGNPAFQSTIIQSISGLVAGTTYDLEFQQAAGQQVGFTGDTTEQWRVFLGLGGVTVHCNTNPCTVTSPNNEEEDSPLMNNPSGHNTDWNTVTLSFTPTAAELNNGTAILTFLAWGDSGSTTNLPPTLFLEGVNTPVVPEPASLALFGAAFFGFGASWLRRGKRSAEA
jgi:hypothetical protein